MILSKSLAYDGTDLGKKFKNTEAIYVSYRRTTVLWNAAAL